LSISHFDLPTGGILTDIQIATIGGMLKMRKHISDHKVMRIIRAKGGNKKPWTLLSAHGFSVYLCSLYTT
jgi:hypothetical protein